MINWLKQSDRIQRVGYSAIIFLCLCTSILYVIDSRTKKIEIPIQPTHNMLDSSYEANKRFHQFEQLLNITLEQTSNGMSVEPLLTNNIDKILERLKDNTKQDKAAF